MLATSVLHRGPYKAVFILINCVVFRLRRTNTAARLPWVKAARNGVGWSVLADSCGSGAETRDANKIPRYCRILIRNIAICEG